jgi:hypothetical protein
MSIRPRIRRGANVERVVLDGKFFTTALLLDISNATPAEVAFGWN